MNRVPIRWSIGLAFVCVLLGCVDNSTPQPVHGTPPTGNSTQIVADHPRTLRIEANVFVETGGITYLALINQADVAPYVKSIIKSRETLEEAAMALRNDKSVSEDKLEIDWLMDHVEVEPRNSGTVAIGLLSDADSEMESIAIVNAIAESFCRREPDRIATEAQRLISGMQEKLAKDPTEEKRMALQFMSGAFQSKRFQESPTIVSTAASVEQN